jgi:hypothetical protein
VVDPLVAVDELDMRPWPLADEDLRGLYFAGGVREIDLFRFCVSIGGTGRGPVFTTLGLNSGG